MGAHTENKIADRRLVSSIVTRRTEHRRIVLREICMAAMSQAEVVAFFADLRKRSKHADFSAFCDFLDTLFRERDLSGCTYYTSLNTFCITRSPWNSERRRKPSLALSVASSVAVLIELRTVTSLKPTARWTTESCSVRYERALDEFDRLYAKFVALYQEA